MTHRITYAVHVEDGPAMEQFSGRLSSAGVQTRHLKSSDRYSYFESSWDDADMPKAHFKGSAGAKPKKLRYKGNPVTCGFIHMLKNEKHLSDAEIGLLFDISESTISRRRKKHLDNGSFYEGSNDIF